MPTSQVFTYSGVTYSGVAAGSTTFALTTSGGLAIGYLDKSHIHVYNADTGVELIRPTQWDFSPANTAVVLKTPATQGASFRLRRITPYASRFTIFQKGTLLTSDQLNASANFNLFVLQEFYDNGGGGSGTGNSGDVALALSRATEALARSTDAMIAAGDAIADAADAKTAADGVAGTANSAVNTATSANTKADNALSQISSINTKADSAASKAEAALAAVADASVFVPVATVAAIPANPTANMRIEVRNSTGIQSRVPAVVNLPVGFVGSSELFVRMDWTGSAWRYDRFGALDPETRYAKNPLPVASTTVAGIVQLVNGVASTSTTQAATAAAVKSAYDMAQSASSTASSASSTASSASATAGSASTVANAALPKAGGTMTGPIVFASTQQKASTAAHGLAQLSNAIDSTSETTAATSKAVKDAIAAAGTGGGGGLTGFRNRIINGGMRIDQRNRSSGLTINASANGWPLDRWRLYAAGSQVVTSRQVGDSTRISKLRLVGASSNASAAVTQYIEYANCRDMAGSTCTLSFDASRSAGTTLDAYVDYCGTEDTFTSGMTQCAYKQFSLTPTLTRYTLTFDMPAAATNGLTVNIAPIALLSGQTFELANVQFELGATATVFERRPYGLEYLLCQRYYERQSSHIHCSPIYSPASTAKNMAQYVHTTTLMRKSPTVTVTAASQSTAPSVQMQSQAGFQIYVSNPGSDTAYAIGGFTADAELV